ncbi:helicase swr1 [Sphaerosporella brunnea]|uniref:Helicase SWR1 n=1 Tax=Sphaerosporella brunnea TaxID=1250544 RepID=A0A5J5F9F7_9PEZI|nr:helicase swr1 [Sphaerosporella brunnea]
MRNTRRRSGESASQENGHTQHQATAESNDASLPADAPPVTTNDTKKPSSKKRKLDESPPWKSATTQTPTAFIIDGRRKSGRTNIIPPEFLALSETSPTREKKLAAQRQAAAEKLQQQQKHDVSFARNASRSASKASANRPQTNGKARNASPSRTASRNTKTPTKSANATRSPSHKKSAPLSRATSKTTPTKTPASRLKPSPAVGTRKSTRALKKAVAAAEEELADSKYDASANGLSDDASSFDTDGEMEVGPDTPAPKLRVKFRIPKPVITNPAHIPPPKPFASFEEFLRQEDLDRDEALLREAEEKAREEAEIRNRIEHEARFGVLTRENCSLFLPEKQLEPDRQYGHHDHLVAHALNFRKLMFKEKKEHQELMKKRNAALMAEIKSRRPRTKEEIEREQYIENRKLFKEQIAQLRRKWDEVMKEVDRRRIQRAEEERRQAGKEHLKQMLQHSTQLLDARRGDRPDSVISEMDADDMASGDDGEADEELIDEDNMTSDSESEPDDQDDDANLTVEQLKAKYAALGSSNSKLAKENGWDGMEIDDDGQLSDQEPMSDVDMLDERIVNGVHDIKAIPELEEVDDILMDDSDDSIDMEDEDDSEGEVDQEEEEDDEDEEDEANTGLLGFYGGVGGLAEADLLDISDDDDDDEVALVQTGRNTEESEEDDIVETEEETARDEPETMVTEEPQIVELEEDGITPKPSDEVPTTNGTKCTSDEAETATSASQVDAKEAALQSSPTTSTEATPAPQPVIKTPIPFLLRGTLREYQHYGLDWLAGLYANHTNGILADEMGLGKTIQTIALLAHLACEKGVWGPHLIVVPTSVMLNWEMEFKKWAPGFKILTYYGSREQRAEKRKGWFDNNLWHVCITSYQLVLQDQVTFKRRNWHYLILDEAHNIKNFRSQRWQTLLNFKSEARLLLTGTPLQNNLVELWSLLYFLMPSGTTSLPTGFANLNEFQEWFAHPVEQLMEGGREGMDAEAKNTVTKLHKVLRPYLLRRLKADVEKQMPGKYEHIVYCRLSKRQRYLYDDFMSMAKTRETLASGNYLSIINCLMQLRKVCNHPDLFETRQIVTSFAMQKSAVADYEIKDLLVRRRLANKDPFNASFSTDFLEFVGLVPAKHNNLTRRHANEIRILSATELLREHYQEKVASTEPVEPDFSTIAGNSRYMKYQSELSHLDKLKSCVELNRIRTHYQPLCDNDLIEVCSQNVSISPLKTKPRKRNQITEWFMNSSEIIRSMIPTLAERSDSLETTITKFGCITPAVVATDMPQITLGEQGVDLVHQCREKYPLDSFHQARIRLSIAFPDKRLLQYDCGKLQRLDALLRELQAGGHRALIFTQMTKVLDILEQFLNIHGHRYLRLDGATKVEQRQALTDRFNNDTRIPVFILSTRSGGLGINLTGADTVIFYDLDWNPAMDKQCQDRCHRIGQTRDVHIYRFVSEYTIESNILRKSDQKRMLDDVVIQEGDFTTDYFNKLTIRDMLGDDVVDELQAVEDKPILPVENMEKALEAAEDLEDVAAAKVAQKEVVDTDVADFAEKGTPQTPAASKDASTPREISVPATTAAPTPKGTATPRETFSELDVNKGLGHDIYGEGWGRIDREPEHIDEYMIRYTEWELIDVPVVIPDKSKRKRSKKGKKF